MSWTQLFSIARCAAAAQRKYNFYQCLKIQNVLVRFNFCVTSGNPGPATQDQKYQNISFMPWRVFYYFGDVAVVIITNSNITINIITNIINILRNNDNRELIKFAVVFVTQKMPD